MFAVCCSNKPLVFSDIKRTACTLEKHAHPLTGLFRFKNLDRINLDVILKIMLKIIVPRTEIHMAP